MGISSADLRATMRTDLVVAMKARDRETVTVLRVALAAFDNAEAVQAPESGGAVGEHIAGARSGAGSTEAARRDLTIDDIAALLQTQIDERATEAATYAEHGQVEAAERLRREAAVLTRYLPDQGAGQPRT